jgi:hypothetical protein
MWKCVKYENVVMPAPPLLTHSRKSQNLKISKSQNLKISKSQNLKIVSMGGKNKRFRLNCIRQIGAV